jgi:hypothetical protein
LFLGKESFARIAFSPLVLVPALNEMARGRGQSAAQMALAGFS